MISGAKTNITNNKFAIESEDYEVLRICAENPKGSRPIQDFKLISNFAKKLSMQKKGLLPDILHLERIMKAPNLMRQHNIIRETFKEASIVKASCLNCL